MKIKIMLLPQSTYSFPFEVSNACRDMAVSQNCVWNVQRRSGRMERRCFVTSLVPDLWSVTTYRKYRNKQITTFKKTINLNYIYIYVCVCIFICISYTVIYMSRICMLKVLTLAVSHFHFSSVRHPCCTPVQRKFALDG